MKKSAIVSTFRDLISYDNAFIPPLQISTSLASTHESVDLGNSPSTPNIVFIILESTGYIYTPLSKSAGAAEMPFFEQLADKSLNVTSARSTFTHTTKSLASIFSGNYAVPSSYLSETELNFPITGLPEYLHSYGYASAFFQSATGEFERRPALIKNLGFDTFITARDIQPDATFIGALNMDDFILNSAIETWVQDQKNPFLLAILTSVTHHPYELPTSNDFTYNTFRNSTSDENKGRYYDALAYSDAFIEKVVTSINSLNTNPQGTIFIIVGDHGEGFGQHGLFSHSFDPYDEALRIPLVINWTGKIHPQQVGDRPFSTIDILPTLFSLVSRNASSTLPGVNILNETIPERNIFFSTWSEKSGIGLIDSSQIKYIYDADQHIFQKYDTRADELEAHDLSGDMTRAERVNIGQILEHWKNENLTGGYDTHATGTISFFNWICEPTGEGSCQKILK